MKKIINVKPLQIKPIPWGWENAETENGQWVVKPTGEIRMPRLVDYFDFSQWEYETIDELEVEEYTLCSTNMKSIFTTAVRFLGYAEALIKLVTGELDLKPIADSMFEWNVALLWHCPQKIDRLIIGDEVGTSRGMMISPELFYKYILPYHRALLEFSRLQSVDVWYHSDGDISDILPVLQQTGFAGVYYEDVGEMSQTLKSLNYPGIEVIRD